MPYRPKADHSSAATCTVLASSPSGTGSATTSSPAASRASRTGLAISGSPAGWITATVRTFGSSRPGSSGSTPVPTTTS